MVIIHPPGLALCRWSRLNSNVRQHIHTLTVPTPFTPRQGQYLTFTYYYTKLNRQPPSETDAQRYFKVSAPSVHQMIIALEQAGHIERKPGQARSVRVLVDKSELPELE